MGEIVIWLTLAGGVVGGAYNGVNGLIFGAVLGFLFGRTLQLGQRLLRAEHRLAELERRVTAAPAETAGETEEEPPAQPAAPAAAETAQQAEVSKWLEPSAEAEPATPAASTSSEAPAQAATGLPAEQGDALPEIEIHEIAEPAEPSREEKLWNAITGFFTDGNVVVRVGIVVLFFGVAFLVKYAAERDLFPIELRLAAAALGGIALTGVGWLLRRRRTAYALLIQGGGIGIFYITIYGAAKIYHLIPMGMAFVLMVAIVALSALLALLQDSRNLAAFGISGGFLAPILTSTGEGNHVMLFSYYALLNAGILGIAWYKAWRELNLLGFLFTFIIGSFWGAQYYRTEHFGTTEPFLILFFLFYVAIAVLFALRQPLKLRGYVDGTLVFGVPVVGFALQAGLMEGVDDGMAWSAFALALFYTVLATALWRRQVEGMRLLTEAFLALGIAFATLAIPLALDARWTASAWALEGAAILWVGVRQQRLLPRISGLLLQVAAGFSFLVALVFSGRHGETAILNGIFLSTVLIALAGLFTAFYLYRHRAVLRPAEQVMHWLALGWGVAWWYLAGGNEIEQFVPWEHKPRALLLFLALTNGVLLWLCLKLLWRVLIYPLMLLLPAAALVSLNILDGGGQLFAGWGLLAWLAVFAVQYRLLWRLAGVYTERLLLFGHAASLWLLLWVVTWEVHWWVSEWLDYRGVWDFTVWGVVPAVAMALLLGPAARLRWPVGRYLEHYRGEFLLPVALIAWCWSLVAIGNSGDPWPLPYLPLFNPLELAQLFVLLVLLMWGWHNRSNALLRQSGLTMVWIWGSLGLAAFLWLNAAVAHTVHHWGGVPYRLHSLHQSMLFQAAISVLWTVCALVLAVSATRRGWRPMWFTGAALLAAVVVKLFLVDLSRSDTMERIISFIVVGALMLLIGYFSPLPPKQNKGREEE